MTTPGLAILYDTTYHGPIMEIFSRGFFIDDNLLSSFNKVYYLINFSMMNDHVMAYFITLLDK